MRAILLSPGLAWAYIVWASIIAGFALWCEHRLMRPASTGELVRQPPKVGLLGCRAAAYAGFTTIALQVIYLSGAIVKDPGSGAYFLSTELIAAGNIRNVFSLVATLLLILGFRAALSRRKMVYRGVGKAPDCVPVPDDPTVEISPANGHAKEHHIGLHRERL